MVWPALSPAEAGSRWNGGTGFPTAESRGLRLSCPLHGRRASEAFSPLISRRDAPPTADAAARTDSAAGTVRPSAYTGESGVSHGGTRSADRRVGGLHLRTGSLC